MTITATQSVTPISSQTFNLPSAFTVGNLKYTATWGLVNNTGYTIALGVLGGPTSTIGCIGSVPTTVGGTRVVLISLGLPNGQSYSFSYDATYGLLNQITYPDGGWVSYTWELPTGQNEIAFWSGSQQETAKDGSYYYQPVDYGCESIYQTPVLATRTVSFDGTNTAQKQTFTYTTKWATDSNDQIDGWSQKTTTVSTNDKKVGSTATTKYTYVPYLVSKQPDASGIVGAAIPLESEIDYSDWGKTDPIKTVKKTWANQFDMQSETTTIVPTSQTSGTIYTYGTGTSGFNTADQFKYLLEQDDYDDGGPIPVQATTNPPSPAVSSSRTPTKITKYSYTCCNALPATRYNGSSAISPITAPPLRQT